MSVTMQQVAEGKASLSALGWLSRTPEDFRSAMLTRCQWRTASAGEAIGRAGETGGGMYGIASGVVEVSAANGPPDSSLVHLAHAGFWAGPRPLLTDQPRRVAVVALNPVLWGNVPLAAVRAMLAEHPAWWRYIGQLSEELGELATFALADMSLSNSPRRGAAVLLRLAGCRHADPPLGMPVRLPITQLQFAQFANMSRQTAGGILRSLEERGLIELSYQSIAILNAAGLRRLVDEV